MNDRMHHTYLCIISLEALCTHTIFSAIYTILWHVYNRGI